MGIKICLLKKIKNEKKKNKMKRSKVCFTDTPETVIRVNEKEVIFEQTMAKNIPELKKFFSDSRITMILEF